MTNDATFLIDHELSLKFTDTFVEYLRRKDWTFLVANPKGGSHLFFNDLRDYHKKEGITFDQFAENLRTLKPERLLRHEAEQSEEFGISTIDYPPIERYLKTAVQETTLFIENLKTLLT